MRDLGIYKTGRVASSTESRYGVSLSMRRLLLKKGGETMFELVPCKDQEIENVNRVLNTNSVLWAMPGGSSMSRELITSLWNGRGPEYYVEDA